MKKLQEKLTEYLESRTVNEITGQNIKEVFEQITTKDEETDLYLSHCLVNQKYEEDKVEKMLTILFKEGLSPNTKAYGGYTFLHQALYGAEIDGKVIPYSLSFFEKIIPLAKQYGYDVNIKDEDGDTLIHSAIYSEDYYGDIEPLIRLLGPDFNLTAKNEQQQTLVDALETSITEATKSKNEKWKEKLIRNKNIITDLMDAISKGDDIVIPIYDEKTTITINDYIDINARYERIEKEINKISINTTSERIAQLRAEISSSKLDESKMNMFLELLLEKTREISTQRKKAIEQKLSRLTIDSKIEECEHIRDEISTSNLTEEDRKELIEKLTEIENEIKNRLFLESLKKSVNSIHTINDINSCLEEAKKIKDETFKKEMTATLNKKLEHARKIEQDYQNTLIQLNRLKRNIDSSIINDYKIGDSLNQDYRETLDIQKMELETEKIKQLIESVSEQLKTRTIINIQNEINMLKEIQANTGIDLITDLERFLDFTSPIGPSPKKKKEKKIEVKVLPQ